jgi:multiple sugar transport system permease protein
MSTMASTDETPAVGGPAGQAGRRRVVVPKRQRTPAKRLALHGFLWAVALIWLAPIFLLVFASLRPKEDTQKHGYLSWPHSLNLKYYGQAWTQGEMGHHLKDSLLIVVPSLVLILFLSSFLAFALTRVKIPFRRTLLILFTAGNLLPPQIMVNPLYKLVYYIHVPLPQLIPELNWIMWPYNTYFNDGKGGDSGTLYSTFAAVVLIHVAFQTGFCVFVLYNYMLTIPVELSEAAVIDGASVWRQYWQVILPVVRPALGALATLEFTWIYNDFLWGLVLMTQGDKLPITTSLNTIRGTLDVDYNLLAAGSMIVALPTLIVFFALQRQFISGLTLGASKG